MVSEYVFLNTGIMIIIMSRILYSHYEIRFITMKNTQ